MKELKTINKIHWIIFNLLVKFFAIGLTLISFLCMGLTLLEFGGKIEWLSMYCGGMLFVPFLFFVVLFVLGIMLIRAKPYRPGFTTGSGGSR